MRYIPESFIDDLLARVDILDLIGRYVTLKKTGSRYMAVCPFHGDKDPSLSVTHDKGLWYCFGCHEGGNAISFIKKKENLEFVDAVRFIARLYNIEVPEVSEDPGVAKRRTLYEINDRAVFWYSKILFSKYGRSFRKYLNERGFKKSTVLAYKIGASIDSWSFITKKLLSEGYSEEELIKSGLSLRGKSDGLYDRFRNRLIIPIIDTLDRTLGFGARAMGNDSPKYINSPESPIFNKSKILFGLNMAKEACRQTHQLVIMEGYTDVMQAYQAGINNCCAVMGTALTEEHVPLLRRYAEEVVLCFDGDEAGRRATIRSVINLGDLDLALKVLPLPETADPADVIIKEGADSFRQRLEKAQSAAEWLFRITAKPVRDSDLRMKLKAFREIAPYILNHKSASVRDKLLEQAALAFNENVVTLQAVLREVSSGERLSSPSSIDALQAAVRGIEQVERTFFLCILSNPDHLPAARELIGAEDFTDPVHRRLAEVILQDGFSLGDPESLVRLPEIDSDDQLRGYVVRLSQTLLEESDSKSSSYSKTELIRSLERLIRRQYDEECRRLQTCMAELSRQPESQSDVAKLNRLLELVNERSMLDRNFREVCRRLGCGDDFSFPGG